jgi:CRISPR system Cascade subunit CasE
MYMSRITLRDDLPSNELTEVAGADGYRIHQLLWELFTTADGSRRPFLYREENPKFGGLSFLALSEVLPENKDKKRPVWNIQTKEYFPQIRQGQQLSFTLRANPVVTRKREDGRRQRHDVVMDARLDRETGQKFPVQDVLYAAGEQWLSSRASKYGFSLYPEALQIHSYRQHRLPKRGKKPVRISTLDYDGMLEVDNSELFVQTLVRGLGPAKGFGCGLLLVRPL